MLLVLFSMSPSGIYAADRALEAVVGYSKPPYVIQEIDSGYELDLVRAVFATIEQPIDFIFAPSSRTSLILEHKKVDLALTIPTHYQIYDLYISKPYINYQNVAITLNRKALNIKTVDDLQHYSVVGFQRAKHVLGDRYAQAISKSPIYLEVPMQTQQVEMLNMERVDAVVMDVNIFHHLAREIMANDYLEKITVHELFPTTYYRLGCKEKAVCDQFNDAFQRFYQTEDYKALLAKYRLHQKDDILEQ